MKPLSFYLLEKGIEIVGSILLAYVFLVRFKLWLLPSYLKYLEYSMAISEYYPHRRSERIGL
jgi:hypothetical protein